MTFSLNLSDVRIDQVTEVDRWPFPTAELFPEVAVQAPDVGDDELVLAIHTYVVRHGDLTVLIDAGNGNAKQRPVLAPVGGGPSRAGTASSTQRA